MLERHRALLATLDNLGLARRRGSVVAFVEADGDGRSVAVRLLADYFLVRAFLLGILGIRINRLLLSTFVAPFLVRAKVGVVVHERVLVRLLDPVLFVVIVFDIRVDRVLGVLVAVLGVLSFDGLARLESLGGLLRGDVRRLGFAAFFLQLAASSVDFCELSRFGDGLVHCECERNELRFGGLWGGS